MKLDDLTLKVWNKSKNCYCDDQDCEQNHKLCEICEGTIVYTAHESNQPKSKFAWNIDHIIPRSRSGSNNINNLQAVHISCNRNKKDK